MRTRSLRTSPWTHFALLALAGLGFSAIRLAVTFRDRRPAAGWGTALEAAVLYGLSDLTIFLPLAAGIAAGATTVRRGTARAAAGVALAALLGMLALDLVVLPAAGGAAAAAARRAPAAWPMPSDTLGERSDFDRRGVVRSAAALLAGGARGVGEIRERYDRDHPRLVAASTIRQGALLLLPLIAVGIAVGASTWVARRVIFRSVRDERHARWALAWVLVPAAVAMLVNWSGSYDYQVLFRGHSLWSSLTPYGPFLGLAITGWRAAMRAAGEAAPELDAAAR